jgi:hypothetical protein
VFECGRVRVVVVVGVASPLVVFECVGGVVVLMLVLVLLVLFERNV